MYRIAVRYKDRALMPMKASRAYRFNKSGKGVIEYDRSLKIHYLRLLVEPSGYKTQEIVIGLDPGSVFDGFSVVSKDTHHFNVELIQRAKKGKNSIKAFKESQRARRRIRRTRLRHRKIRFDNRTKNKLAPTIRANVDFRKWTLNKLFRYFPISKVAIEDVSFNHYKSSKGASFSHVEQGKNELYRFVVEDLNTRLEIIKGWITKNLRLSLYDKDPKVKGLNNKGSKTFEAHCLDSFVIAAPRDSESLVDLDPNSDTFKEVTGSVDLCKFPKDSINKSVVFIEKIVSQKRKLHRNRKNYNLKSEYFRYSKGGVKRYFNSYSNKKNVCRLKEKGNQSNHPKSWIYLENEGFVRKSKYSKARYGGMKSRFHSNDNYYINRKVSIC